MSWKPEYLALILITTLVSYYSARRIEADRDNKKRYLLFCVLINFGILFIFKYLNFFSSILSDVSGSSFFELKVLLPVGISFYTFQTVSYLADVYRGQIKAEKDIAFFALFVSFFPQLVAGPIERASNLLPQFKEKREYDYERIRSGIGIMLFGFFKKVVIADRIAVLVDRVFTDYSSSSSLSVIIAVFLFGIQIYCDFSGYSDIAVGSARIMGIELMQNFKRPYFAKSVSEFWKRWHISLSSWFKDYVYIPLGGNRKGKSRTLLNLLITFVTSGLWHGANLTFVVWGLVHGIFLVFEKLFSIPKKRHLFWIIPTYICVNLAWVLFRSPALFDAYGIYIRIFSFDMTFDAVQLGLDIYHLYVLGFSLLLLLVHSIIAETGRTRPRIRTAAYAALLAVIVFFGYFTSQEFIYFRF
jgi:D-alanyl-lipoteichoic acid acyltransferase DltB (MBOAT superfamily)